jgi:superfamily II DNA or RNA helicase
MIQLQTTDANSVSLLTGTTATFVKSNVGAMTILAPCGIGKMVCQVSLLPRTRSINLVVSGIRLVLAGQMNDRIVNNISTPSNLIHVMSKQEYQSQNIKNTNLVSNELLQHPQKIAHALYEYVCGNNQYPLYVSTIEQSFYKVIEAFKILKNGELVDVTRDGDNLYPWCNDQNQIDEIYQRVVELCELAIYDEAHNLVCGDSNRAKNFDEGDKKESRRKSNYYEDLPFMNGIFTRSTYWTATRQINRTKRDMTNKQMFGPVVVNILPSEAVKLGYTVKPHLVQMRFDRDALITEYDIPSTYKNDRGETCDLDYRNQVEIAFIIASKLRSMEDCEKRGLDSRDIVFMEDAGLQEIARDAIVKYFIKIGINISVNFITYETPQNVRGQFFKEFAEHHCSLLLNYAIVHEGVDIDRCTGVIIGRNLNQVWAVQAIGRACRLDPVDRATVWADNSIVPTDRPSHYLKKYGLVYTFEDEEDADCVAANEKFVALYKMLRDSSNGEDWLGLEVVNHGSGTRGKPERKSPDDPQARTVDPDSQVNETMIDAMRITYEEQEVSDIMQDYEYTLQQRVADDEFSKTLLNVEL